MNGEVCRARGNTTADAAALTKEADKETDKLTDHWATSGEKSRMKSKKSAG